MFEDWINRHGENNRDAQASSSNSTERIRAFGSIQRQRAPMTTIQM